MIPFDFQPRTRVVFAPGAIHRAGELAHELGFPQDARRRRCRHRQRGSRRPSDARRSKTPAIADPRFSEFGANPDSEMVARRPRRSRAPLGVDSIVALGGGSSLDCAKGINFLLTNGGTIADYRGYGKASTAAAADDRDSHDRGHRKRGAELRGHLRCRDAHEDGVRRSVRRVPDRDPRSGTDRDRAAPASRRWLDSMPSHMPSRRR